jgi:hypothetical protein
MTNALNMTVVDTLAMDFTREFAVPTERCSVRTQILSW